MTVNSAVMPARKFVTIIINRTQLTLQYDSGSDLTIIAERYWKSLGSPQLQPCTTIIKSAQGNLIPLLGSFTTNIKCMDRSGVGTIHVAPFECNLFGIDTISLLGLWSVPPAKFCMAVTTFNRDNAIAAIKEEFSDIFSETLGFCTKTTAKLTLLPGAAAVFRPKRPVPYGVMSLVEDELQRLQDLQVITPVDCSEWAAPIVVVRKPNGTVRICGDYSTGLNEAIEPNLYPIPTTEELYGKLVRGKVFATIDLSDAYLQIGVCDQSRKYLTIHTHKGLFNFNRLAPGIRSAPGIFQRIVDQLVAGLPDVVDYFDDICVAGEDEHDLLHKVREVLRRIRSFGFHIKAEKCQFFLEEVKFLGNIINKDGIHTDPGKTSAIRNMPPPTDEATLRSYLGSITHYSRYIKGMSNLTAPLSHLLKKGVNWKWTKECQASFDKFKEILQSPLALTHYLPDMPLEVAADASSIAIGAQISHVFPDGSRKAIEYAARSLTKAEKQYSQIEREALGLVYAVKHFHRYIYGRKFTLVTDHKPLLVIFGSTKGIAAHAANRIQRWQLIMHAYYFDIKYTSTTEFGYVDVLSRLVASQQPEDEYVIACTHLEDNCKMELAETINKFPVTVKEIIKATSQCPQLQQVKKFMCSGWPPSVKAVPKDAQEFYRLREHLHIVKSCVLYRNRVVIPHIFRQRILHRLHDAHPGQERMLSLARSFVYWPGVDEDIRKYVQACSSCQLAAKTPTRSVLYSWPSSQRPWQRIHIDYAQKDDNNFLVIVDSYSKWPEIEITSSTTTERTIDLLEDKFNSYGYPEVIVSDNGVQFTSALFSEFCTARNIEHIRTSTYFPQSNGQAERYVDTFKRSLRKMHGEGSVKKNLGRFLINFRSTPHPSNPHQESPAELFIGRPLRTTLSSLIPREEEKGERNTGMEKVFNKKHGAKARTFHTNDQVYAKHFKRGGHHFSWIPGVILEPRGECNFMVFVTLPGGRQTIMQRHTNQLRIRTDEPADEFPLERPVAMNFIIDEPVNNMTSSSHQHTAATTAADRPLRSRLPRYQPTREQPPVTRSATRNLRA